MQDLFMTMVVTNRLLGYKSIIMGQPNKQLVKGNVKNTPTKMNIDKALVPNNERKSSCFIYQGLHYAHDFPNKVELNAL